MTLIRSWARRYWLLRFKIHSRRHLSFCPRCRVCERRLVMAGYRRIRAGVFFHPGGS